MKIPIQIDYITNIINTYDKEYDEYVFKVYKTDGYVVIGRPLDISDNIITVFQLPKDKEVQDKENQKVVL